MTLNPLLVVAAVVYGLSGLALTFVPAELLTALQAPTSAPLTWLAQLLGAALLGLSSLNYLHRYAPVRGVLGRPLLLSNLVFLSASFFASLSSWRHDHAGAFLLAALVLGPLLAAFALRLFKGSPQSEHPTKHGAA